MYIKIYETNQLNWCILKEDIVTAPREMCNTWGMAQVQAEELN